MLYIVCAKTHLTLVYMGYFDYLFYVGGKKAPPLPRSNSGIWLPTDIKLGMIILWGKNSSNLAKQFMTAWPLFKYDVIYDCRFVATAKNV